MSETQKYIYCFISAEHTWEGVRVVLSEKKAIQLSVKYPQCRVEIYQINNEGIYCPTYRYIRNGVYGR